LAESAAGRAESGDEPLPSPGAASRRIWVLAAAMATIFITAIEGTIVATALPVIVGELGGFDLFSWVFTGYLLTQAATTPIYGRLADLYGRKRVLFVGLALFLVGSVLCGFAWSMVWLVVFRVVQGIGTGALVPVAQTIIADLYPPAERARIQGYLSSVWGVGAILGPLVGAWLVAHASWSMVFWVNVPIAITAWLMLALTLQERIERRPHRIDYLGSLLMILATSLLMFVLVDAAALSIAAVIVMVAASAVLLVLFLLHERRAPEPMLPIDLWRNPIIAGGNLACLMLGAVIMGSTAFLSLYVQGVMGGSALVAGFALASMSISWPFGSSAGGRLMLRTSYRTAAATGGLPLLAGSVVMIELDPSRGPLWAAAGALLIGIGMGFTINTFVVAIQSTVDWGRRGVATSTTVFTRIIGQSMGAAVFGGILNAGLADHAVRGSDAVNRIMDPALRQSLPAAELAPLVEAIAQGLHKVYLLNGVLVLVVLATVLCLPAGLNPTNQGKTER
jgi:EmrB/QacA subfamily drug resistance transporter